jgi:hypothetical protein
VQRTSNEDENRDRNRQQPVGKENGKETEKAAQHPQPAGQTPNMSGAQYE